MIRYRKLQSQATLEGSTEHGSTVA